MGATVVSHVGMQTLDGARTIVIVAPPEGKLGEYFDHMVDRQRIFAAVEGYDFKIDICGDISNA